ncbi:hypothetical protein FRX31_025110 [Thalictrum thalictroides]|uniref:Uncharacterized protein n=1 Tax=Thalictrum thalictroides TaxID=46969 RepID=A0A7J6VKK4_THATH|nr:hypothetical protein FRX31_025110 [Thalictrum thalictroides]
MPFIMIERNDVAEEEERDFFTLLQREYLVNIYYFGPLGYYPFQVFDNSACAMALQQCCRLSHARQEAEGVGQVIWRFGAWGMTAFFNNAGFGEETAVKRLKHNMGLVRNQRGRTACKEKEDKFAELLLGWNKALAPQ